MANSNSSRTLVPEAKDSLNQFKYEVASEVGVNLKNGYNSFGLLVNMLFKRMMIRYDEMSIALDMKLYDGTFHIVEED